MRSPKYLISLFLLCLLLTFTAPNLSAGEKTSYDDALNAMRNNIAAGLQQISSSDESVRRLAVAFAVNILEESLKDKPEHYNLTFESEITLLAHWRIHAATLARQSGWDEAADCYMKQALDLFQIALWRKVSRVDDCLKQVYAPIQPQLSDVRAHITDEDTLKAIQEWGTGVHLYEAVVMRVIPGDTFE